MILSGTLMTNQQVFQVSKLGGFNTVAKYF